MKIDKVEQIECPSCSSRQIRLLCIEHQEKQVILNLLCENCGSLTTMHIEGVTEKNPVVKTIKKSTTYTG